MPKNQVAESLLHHLLRAIERRSGGPAAPEPWRELSRTLEIETRGELCLARWSAPRAGEYTLDPKAFSLYRRGDAPAHDADSAAGAVAAADAAVEEIARRLDLPKTAPDYERLRREAGFHDDWAEHMDPADVKVRESFEACTAPEHRYILERLGDLRGKKLLDLGCGLGEAAVYFAIQGADVTACDLSPRMLDMTQRVAAKHGVSVAAHQGSAEATGLPDASFDAVYAGNVLHHADTEAALDEIKRLLKPGGRFATWDPLQHNPVINVYRRMAADVRTPDEHPLRMEQLAWFSARFSDVEHRGFWLSTLVIFLRFYFWERVHPSKERYWKKILTDHQRLEPLYKRLESFDRALLRACPWLERYCWNIVVLGRKA